MEIPQRRAGEISPSGEKRGVFRGKNDRFHGKKGDKRGGMWYPVFKDIDIHKQEREKP